MAGPKDSISNLSLKLPKVDLSHSKPPSRRRIVDRRDPDNQPARSEEDRRTQADRRGNEPSDDSAVANKSNREQEKLAKQREMRVQQRRKKKLIAACEPVTGMNFDVLAMDDYPDNQTVLRAKRERDFWLLSAAACMAGFAFGLIGLVPAIVGGVSVGFLLMCLLMAFTSLRKRLLDQPMYHELMQQRRVLEFQALSHIRFLEGTEGLAWRCEKMRQYNSNLERKLFKGMVEISRELRLLEVIRNRKQIRLYLLFMVEAQKAYQRLQQDYLQHHFKHLEEGWDDSSTEGLVPSDMDGAANALDSGDSDIDSERAKSS